MPNPVMQQPKTWSRRGEPTWLGFLAIPIVITLLWPAHGAPLNWDEVDYVKAARLGVMANALETGGLGFFDFVRFAYDKASNRRPPRLPQWYREEEDPVILRHFHPPLLVYLTVPFASTSAERLLRLPQLVGAVALVVVGLCGYRRLAERRSFAGALAVGAVATLLSLSLFRNLSCHGWQAVWLCALATCLGCWLRERRIGHAVGTIVLVSLTIVTLQTGLVVFVAVTAVVGILLLVRDRVSWASAAQALIAGSLLMISLLVWLWPALLAKLAYARILTNNIYMAVLGQEHSAVLGHMLPHLKANAVLVATYAATVSWLLIRRPRPWSAWIGGVVISVSYLAAMARFALAPQYLLPAAAPLLPMIGSATSALRAPWVVLASFGLAALLNLPTMEDPAAAAFRKDLAWLEARRGGRLLLADGGHIYAFYLNDGVRVRPIHLSYDQAVLLTREAGEYRPLTAAEVRGHLILIQSHRQAFFEPAGGQLLLRPCPKQVRTTFVLYDCGHVD